MSMTRYEVNREAVDKLPPHVRTFVDVKSDGSLMFYLDIHNSASIQETLVTDVDHAKTILGNDVLTNKHRGFDDVVELAMQTLKKEPIFISDMSHFYYRGK